MTKTATAAILAALAGFIGVELLAAAKGGSMKDDKQSSADAALRAKLTPEQYHVVRENGTEPPFKNKYWDNHEEGIYVDVVSGEPLFSSKDKFESGTGWPSFTRPLDRSNIVLKSDSSLWMTRTEVRSKKADSHLGHVFDDGPKPTGKRYCINSAALRLIPVSKLAEEGYGAYLSLFTAAAPSGELRPALRAGGATFPAAPDDDRRKAPRSGEISSPAAQKK